MLWILINDASHLWNTIWLLEMWYYVTLIRQYLKWNFGSRAREGFWMCLLPNRTTGVDGKCSWGWGSLGGCKEMYRADSEMARFECDLLRLPFSSVSGLLSDAVGSKYWMLRLAIHFVIYPPVHCFYPRIAASWSSWWNLYFSWLLSARLHLMNSKWFIIEMHHERAVRWTLDTFWFELDH